jgi:hypothetical protein
MINFFSKIVDHKIRKNKHFSDGYANNKTTNVNILLNRVRIEKKKNSKKKIILIVSIISILSFLSIIIFNN